LVENNVWTGTDKPLYSTDGGFAVATGNDFGGAANTGKPSLRDLYFLDS
jgi:pectate lyase